MAQEERRNKRDSRIFPLLSLLCSILVFAGGLITAPNNGWIFLAACCLVFLIFGMWKGILKILPIWIFFGGIYFAIAYAINRDIPNALAGVWRVGAITVAIVPSLYLHAEDLLRSLNQMKFPRPMSLGLLITLRFFPLLGQERKRIKEAMKSRAMPFSFKRFYRSTIIPFVVRLVHISDALSLSIETKGFQKGKKDMTIYKKVPFYAYDVIFAVLIIASFTVSLIYLPGLKLW